MTVLVLSILVVLGYAFSYSAGVYGSTARNARDALRRECAAESALNMAMAMLRANGGAGKFDSLDQPWAADDLSARIGTENVLIKIVDENRKLNVNRAACRPADPTKGPDLRDALERLVESAGGSRSDFDAICAWIDPGTPGPHDDLAPKSPLPMIVGLRRVPELRPDLFAQSAVKPQLDSLLSTHPARINLNTARREVLDALWGDPTITEQVIEQRQQPAVPERCGRRPVCAAIGPGFSGPGHPRASPVRAERLLHRDRHSRRRAERSLRGARAKDRCRNPNRLRQTSFEGDRAMNPTRAFLIAGVLSLALALGAFAAPPPAPAVSKPEEMVTINFAGVTLHAIVQYLSEFSGKPILLPDKFPGDRKVDIVSSGQAAYVPVKKAAEILSTALRSAGYVMIETPYQIQIVAEANAEGAPVVQDQNEGAIAGQTLVTITKEVKKADASKLQTILTALKSKAGNVQLYPDSNTLIITEYGPQLKTMLTLIDKLDTRWEGNRPDIVTLEKSSVDSLRSVVDAFVKNMALNAEPAVKKRLESFSIIVQPPINSFVLFGYPDDVARVKEFIRMIDVLPADASRTFHTYRVLNRDVAEMVSVLNGVFTAVKARGGAAAAEQCPTVIADQTNSALIVIASPDRYTEYLPLFKQIDKPKDQVQIESAIVELSTDRLADLGVELATADVPSATSGVVGAVGTTFGLTTVSSSGARTPVLPTNGGLTAAVFKNLNIAAIARLSLQDQNVAFIAGPLVTINDNVQSHRGHLRRTPDPAVHHLVHGPNQRSRPARPSRPASRWRSPRTSMRRAPSAWRSCH